MIYYTSDHHFGHKNIIRYTRRPFGSTEHMDAELLFGLRSADLSGSIVHAGDISFDLARIIEQHGPLFDHPEHHLFIAGNHDKVLKQREAYAATFGRIIGDEKSWLDNSEIIEDTLHGVSVKVLVSHNPQRDLQGCDYNVYGHVHNNLDHSFEWHIENYGREWVEWLATSEEHLNASVELTSFVPVSLSVLILDNRRFQTVLREKLKAA